MTLTPLASAADSIEAPVAESRASSRMTLAPCVRHWSPWERCVWALPCAFRTVADTPAALKAASRYGLSNSWYRVDEVVSGSRAHASILAALRVGEVRCAEAAAASSSATSAGTARSGSDRRMNLVKTPPSEGDGERKQPTLSQCEHALQAPSARGLELRP